MALPVLLALAVVQAPGTEAMGLIPAIGLAALGQAFAFGADQVRDMGGDFEWRRRLTAASIIVVLTALLSGIAGLGWLFPVRVEESPRPPGPAFAAHASGGVLFEVRAPQPVPLRMGVLERVGDQWLTAPYDPSRLVRGPGGDTGGPRPIPSEAAAVSVSVVGAGVGRFLPTAPGLYSLSGLPAGALFDPEAGTIRTETAVEPGLRYTLRLRAVPAERMAEIAWAETSVEAPPPTVAGLLQGDTPRARATAGRTALFAEAVEGAAGDPVPVTADRVVEIVRGSPASAWELAVAETTIARWAGLDARVAYGYLTRDRTIDGGFVVDAADAAAWPEIRTADGHWLPLIDRPGLAPQEAGVATRALPNGEQIAQVYVPVQRPADNFLLTVVRYWLSTYALIGAGVAALALLIPAGLRAWRGMRRSRWAEEAGPRARIAVAYATLRDAALDAHAGTGAETPREFVDLVETDEDHVELAWLVDRGLFGDLRRDLSDDDARAAEALATSLRRRFVQGQTYWQRAQAIASTRSLRQPWDPAMPGVDGRVLGIAAPASWPKPIRLGAIAAVLVLALAVPFVVGVDRADLRNRGTAELLPVPAEVGRWTLTDTGVAQGVIDGEPQSLIGTASQHHIRRGDIPIGTLQQSAFKGGLQRFNKEARDGVVASLGMTSLRRWGPYVTFERRLGTMRQILWFAPDGLTYHLLTVLASERQPEAEFVAMIAGQLGQPVPKLEQLVLPPPPDARENP